MHDGPVDWELGAVAADELGMFTLWAVESGLCTDVAAFGKNFESEDRFRVAVDSLVTGGFLASDGRALHLTDRGRGALGDLVVAARQGVAEADPRHTPRSQPGGPVVSDTQWRQQAMFFENDRVLRGEEANYRITGRLSGGGAGATYTAIVDSLGERSSATYLSPGASVVIKVPGSPRRQFSLQEERRFISGANESLRKEYRLLKRLMGLSSAAHVYDAGSVHIEVGQSLELCFFVVHQFINGKPLDVWRSQLSETVSAETFFFWARELVLALDEIHHAGVVHGDIWPPNIMIVDNTRPVFIDFGQAVIRHELERSFKTENSHPYIPPEREHTVHADIFGLCATLYFLATGKPPPAIDPDIDELRNRIANGLKEFNRPLYNSVSGIADIIARGLRYLARRTPDTEDLMRDIDLFDPQTAVAVREVGKLLDEVRGMVSSLESKEPLFARMAGERVRRLKHYVEEMHQLGIYDLRGNHETLVRAASQYLAACEPGDLYLTASVPWFWRDANLGVQGRFLSMNKHIIKKNTTVRRVFVVTQGELESPETKAVLAAHARMLTEVREEMQPASINTTEKEIAAGGVFTGVLIVTEQRREELFRDYPHCGTWIRGSASKIMIPFYDETGRELTGIRVRQADRPASALIDAFQTNYLLPADELITFIGRQTT